jgi:polysaccharide export outer membrane protein
MPRIGKTRALCSLWVLLGACLLCTGCTTDRDAILAEMESPMWQSAQPGGPSGPTPATTPEPRAVMPPAQSIPPAQVVPPGQPGVQLVAPPPGPGPVVPSVTPVPHELEQITHPTYVIQPPDVLLIDAARLVPLPPYRVEPLDVLLVYVTGTLPKEPIEGLLPVDAAGKVNLGFGYGTVDVLGKTLEETKEAIKDRLKKKLNPPFEVYLSLSESKIMQQIRGDHLVRQDGTIGLGTYGQVYVTGLTIAQAKAAIEKHLEQYLFKPKLSVDVSGYNSRHYFVIIDFPGTGEMIIRLPITGNETVLDALGTLRFLPQGVSRQRIWVARPAPAKYCRTQILPVDWKAITRNGSTATNYQLLPGDRIYVAPDPCSQLDAQLARLFAPVERVFGIALLGNSSVLGFRTSGNNGFNNGVGGVR